MDEPETEKMPRDEQDIARLLRAVGPREAMPKELRGRWEQQFRSELKPVLQKRRGRRYTMMGLVASVVVVGFVTLLNWQTPKKAALMVQVVSVSGEGRMTRENHDSQELQVGQSLEMDNTVTTGNSSFAALSYQGYDLRLNSNSSLRFVPEGISLESGEIYVSNEAGSRNSEGVTVITRFGSIRDIGTQFTVSIDQTGVVSTVRRGAIVVSTEAEKIRAEAGVDSARQIILDGEHGIRLSDSSASGPNWEWIYHSSSGFELEGQTVAAFLRWSCRESGMRLKYSTESAKIYASTTILHGDIMDLNPDQAVEPVLAGTHLAVQRRSDNTLQVALLPRH